eukprot:UN02939
MNETERPEPIYQVFQIGNNVYKKDERTLIMGILNATPDSFSDGGLYNDSDKAISQITKMVEDGADIIDIGGQSTKPGAKTITTDEEISRVIPILERIQKNQLI